MILAEVAQQSKVRRKNDFLVALSPVCWISLRMPRAAQEKTAKGV